TFDALSGNTTSAPLTDYSFEDTSTYVVSSGFTPDGAHAFVSTANDAGIYLVSVPMPVHEASATGVILDDPNLAGGAVAGSLSYTDCDGDPLTYGVAAQGSHGTVTVVPGTGACTYTPSSTTNATSDTFSLTVNDGHGGVVPVSVTVPIVHPDAPTNALPV